MSRSVPDRLRDILCSADLGGEHARGLSAEALAATPLTRDATLFRIAVMCEAASQLPADVKALAPEIPWSDIRGMRNHIVHGYWQIDFASVANVIANDLEPLKTAVQRLIIVVEANRR